jgi:hypothetical protein
VGSPDVIFVREYWSGDSRDGSIVNGDGYHFFKMSSPSLILEAFELYETDDGTEVVTRLPEMENIDWVTDLGFANLDDLDVISERDYQKIKDLCAWSRHSEAS